MESLFDLALKKKVDLLFLSGDLFNEEYFTLTDMKRLTDLFHLVPDTSIIISPGNHDPYRVDSLWCVAELPENVYIFTEEKISRFEFPEIDIYGAAFQNQHLKEENLFDDLSLDPDKTNILVLHGDLFDMDSPYLPINREQIDSLSFDYIALGHIHKPVKLSKRIIYPGSIEPLDFSEKGEHGVIYGEINGEYISTEQIPLSDSIFLEYEFEIQEQFNYYQLKKELEKIKETHQGDLYFRLLLKGTLSREYEIDIEGLYENVKDNFIFLEIVDEIQQEYDIEKIYELNRSNLIGLFIDEIKNKEDNPYQEIALQLGIEALIEHGEK